eukprot:3318281-Pyramimonas_sp.AAC.1
MTEATPVGGPPELQGKSLYTSAEAEGGTLGSMAVRSTESYSMARVSDGEFDETESVSDPIFVPGQELFFLRVSAEGLVSVAFSGVVQTT